MLNFRNNYTNGPLGMQTLAVVFIQSINYHCPKQEASGIQSGKAELPKWWEQKRELKINVRISYFTVSFEKCVTRNQVGPQPRKDFAEGCIEPWSARAVDFQALWAWTACCTAAGCAEILNDGQWYQLERAIYPGPSLSSLLLLSTLPI